MSDILAIVTGFHAKQLWESITQSDFNISQGVRSDTRSGGPFNVPKSISQSSFPEYFGNYFKSLGAGAYKGRLTVSNASVQFVTDVQTSITASQCYTIAKYDDVDLSDATVHPNRYFGSRTNITGGSGSPNPFVYKPVNDNTTIVVAWKNTNGFKRFDERLNINGGTDFIRISNGSLYDYGAWSPDIAYKLDDGTRLSRPKIRVGFTMLEDAGFLAHLYADDHYVGTDYQILRAYDCIKPYVGQNVAVRTQGAGYGINFNSTLVSDGLGYGAKNEYTSGDGLSTGGTNYPDNSVDVADTNIIGTNGGVQVLTLGGGQGMSVEFTASGGVINTVNIVDSGLGYIAGDVITIKGNTTVINPTDNLGDGREYKITNAGIGVDYSSYTNDTNPAIGLGTVGTIFIADNLGGPTAPLVAGQLEDLTSEGENTPAQFIYADQTLAQRIEFDAIIDDASGVPSMPLGENYDVNNRNATPVKSEVPSTGGNGRGQSQNCSAFNVRIKTGAAGELLDVAFSHEPNGGGSTPQPTGCEDGDIFYLSGGLNVEAPVPPYPNPAQRGTFSTVRWFRNVPTTTAGGGVGLTVDFRRDGEGKIIDVRPNEFGSGYLVGDIVTIEGGNPSNPAQLEITETNIRTTTGGLGAGMEVELDVGNESNINTWNNGASALSRGVRQIKITDIGNGLYKSGDIITVDGGDGQCTFGLFFAPEFGSGRNTVNPLLNVYERRWHRHWKSAGGDYRFRMCNQARQIIDVDGAGMPIDPAEGVADIKEFDFGRSMFRTGNGVNAIQHCDLNIREFDAPADLVALDTNFDPDALQPVATIDDLAEHSRVMPIIKKPQSISLEREVVGGFDATTDGDPDNWESTLGSNIPNSVLRDMVDGNTASFGRAANSKFGIETKEYSFDDIVKESGYIMDTISSVSVTAHKVVDPDGDIMETVARKAGETEYTQEESIPSGEESTFHGYWGDGDADFTAMAINKWDGKTHPAWVSAGTYTIGEIITYSGSAYVALTDHSGIVTTPDVDGTNWSLLGDEGKPLVLAIKRKT